MPLYWSQYVGAAKRVLFVAFLWHWLELISHDIFLSGDGTRPMERIVRAFLGEEEGLEYLHYGDIAQRLSDDC
jgi:hypothetical protein